MQARILGTVVLNIRKDAVTAMFIGRMKPTAIRFHRNNAAKHEILTCRQKRNVTKR